ncbi:methionine synthase reductase-like [Asterias amurensis]|uniref:methionine synthase reductase-like n=1 Tax=Asterias amurensis TaxID=7602 RepID=UPI003AB31BED
MTKGNQGRFLLLYGSQTGQAKAIAEEIFETSPQHGLDPEMHCLSVTDKKFCIENEKCVVIIVSTTGEGEPPDTATKFWRRLKKKTLPSDHLSQVEFTLLGLGDSNYTNFCQNGKNFNQRLQALGAGHFYPPGFADDATGLEIVAEPWMEGLYPALCKCLAVDTRSGHQNDNDTTGKETIYADREKAVEGNRSTDDLNLSDLKSVRPVEEIAKAVSHLNVGDSTDGIPSKDSGQTGDVSLNDNANPSDSRVYTTDVPGFSPTDDAHPTNNAKTSNVVVTQSSKSRTTNSGIAVLQTIEQDSQTEVREETATQRSGQEKLNNEENKVQSSTEETSSAAGQSGVVQKAQGGKTASEGHSSTVVTVDSPCLKQSVPPLSESGLTLPLLPPPFLEVEFHAEKSVNLEELPLQGGAKLPSASSEVTMATLTTTTQLTRDDAVKTALDVELDITGSGMSYQPGDSFSIICPNDDEEVNDLIQRLGQEDKADCPLSLKVMAGTKKRRAAVPEYIPQPLCTLRHALKHSCDIRSPPKKAFLRVLVEHTDVESEKRRLQELCSKQGASNYGAFIRDPHLSLMDILTAFPSCNPPISRVFEHLTRLQPRPYSISSSPLVNPSKLHFVFNVVVFPEGQGRSKKRGVCTGWLSHMTKGQEEIIDNSVNDPTINLGTDSLYKIPIFERSNQHFHLPADPATPIIMIGPGTGVAPFKGFLDHRACLKKDGASVGSAWLFFGCRHKERDFLYRELLQEHLSSGILTKLSPSFSRDPAPAESSHDATCSEVPRYVQDNLKLHAAALCRLILEDKAVVYVCGDAKHMAKNVAETFSDIFIKETGRNAYEAAVLLASLREEKRYLEDVWT